LNREYASILNGAFAGLRDENEIRLKQAYWQGVYDALSSPDRSRSERSERDRVTAEVWLAALDWLLGQAEDSTSMLSKSENRKA
jgi:hypothetical protein